MEMTMSHSTFPPPCARDGHGSDPYFTENSSNNDHGENFMSNESDPTFPGPLLSSKTEKEDVLAFILMKSEEALLHVEQPEQKEAYIFWQIMELFCKRDGNITMAEIAIRIFRSYRCMRRKAPKFVCGGTQRDWCLALANLLCSAAPERKLRQVVIGMANDLVSTGQLFAAHVCCVVAGLKLGSYVDFNFDLIGCSSFPPEKDDFLEAIQRTEVYEYVEFMASGTIQPSFQKYKAYYASMLAEEGLYGPALDYCESVARAFLDFPFGINISLLKQVIVMSKELNQWTTEEPSWLFNLRQLHEDKVQELAELLFKPDEDEMLTGLPPFPFPKSSAVQPTPKTTPEQDFSLRYFVGELLGKGGFGCVYAGRRREDGKKVAIKYVEKSDDERYITIPGQTQSLPCEVALMQMASVPPRCDNIVELLEWFETPSSFILVMERPSPCINLFEFLKRYDGQLPEPLARDIMRQVVQATRHCCERGVLHRDIKPENLLINTKTLQVKLIDFGCGDILKDETFTKFAGTLAFCPPELLVGGEYMGRPATVWSLGVLLYVLMKGHLPFNNPKETAYGDVPQTLDLSDECEHLICWCLDKSPYHRATLEDIMEHEWFTGYCA